MPTRLTYSKWSGRTLRSLGCLVLAFALATVDGTQYRVSIGLVGLSLVLTGGSIDLRRNTRDRTGRRAEDLPGRLIARAGPLQGNRFPIPAPGIKIGRDPAACQIVLNEPSASREHALVIPAGSDAEVMVRNLSRTNPTYVNDRPVQEVILKHRDRIRIATSVLVYERL